MKTKNPTCVKTNDQGTLRHWSPCVGLYEGVALSTRRACYCISVVDKCTLSKRVSDDAMLRGVFVQWVPIDTMEICAAHLHSIDSTGSATHSLAPFQHYHLNKVRSDGHLQGSVLGKPSWWPGSGAKSLK